MCSHMTLYSQFVTVNKNIPETEKKKEVCGGCKVLELVKCVRLPRREMAKVKQCRREVT